MLSSTRIWIAIGVAGAILLMVGLRWELVEEMGSSVPQHDQWQAEPDYLYKPWLSGGVPLQHFLHPHNGHRIAPTRALALGLFVGNQGQWDGKLQMTANAILAALVLIPLVGLMRPFMAPSVLLLSMLGMVYLYGSAVLYENALWGFQSQFYFLIVFSLGHIWGVLHPGQRKWLWAMGWLAGLIGIFSFGSGWIAPVITTVLTVWHHGVRQMQRRPAVWLLLGLAVIGVGVAVTTPSPSLEISLTGQTLVFAAKLLAVPVREVTWFGLLGWAPLILWLILRPVRLKRPSLSHLGVMAVVAWLLAHVAAIVVGREPPAGVVPNRYLDIMAVGLAINAVGWAAMAPTFCSQQASLFRRWGFGVACCGWVGAMLWAVRQTDTVHRENVAPILERIYGEQVERVRGFLESRDASWLREKPYPSVPSAVVDQFEKQLRDPVILQMFPPEIQPSIPLHFPDHPELDNALPVFVPHLSGVVNRGTYLPDRGAAAQIDTHSHAVGVPFPSHLRIMWAGQIERDATGLVFESVDGSNRSEITPPRSSTAQVAAVVPTPAKEIRLHVLDRSDQHWIAFSRIHWVGPWSHQSSVLRRHAGYWQGAGGLLWGLALVVLVIADGRRVIMFRRPPP